MNPLVSILIPVYNRKNLVGETIESAINQTYKNIEIVIVDNCSTDGTWELLQEFEQKDNRIRIFQNPENIGPVRNWKRCIDEAKGEYAKFLFSDDLIAENFIGETLTILKSNSEIGFVISSALILNKSQTSKIYNFDFNIIDSKTYITNTIIKGNYPNSPGCALFRLVDLKQNLLINIENPYNLDFSIYGAGNDLLIFMLIARKYKYIAHTNVTYSVFKSHEDSFTVSNKLGFYYDYAKYYFLKTYNINNKLLSFMKYKFLLYSHKDKRYIDISNKIRTKNSFLSFLFLLIKRYIK